MLDRTTPTHILTDLKHQRLALGEEIARLHEARDRLRDAEADELAALAEIGAQGHAEVASMSAWANAGAIGPAPEADQAKREALAKRLAAAAAKAAAARAVGVDVEDRLREATARGAAVANSIKQTSLAIVIEEYQRDRAELEVLAAEVRAQVAHVFGALSFVREHAEEHRVAGRAAEATALFRLLEPLLMAPPPDCQPGSDEVVAEMPSWSARFEELLR